MRWSESVCVVEGPDLIDAALDGGAEFEGLYVDRDVIDKYGDVIERTQAAGFRVFALEAGVIAKIADATTPQPILAAVRFRTRTLDDVSLSAPVVVLHEMRDPGNVGTVIRSAAAFGCAAVIVSGHSVDPYNPKTLRATAGAIFRLPVVVEENLPHVVSWAQQNGGRVIATVVRGGDAPEKLMLGQRDVMLIGNEAEGLSEEAVAMAHSRVTLPMTSRTESLNASVAASVLMYLAFSANGHRSTYSES